MKKLFIAALLAVSVVITAYADNSNDVNASILYSFKHDFAAATNVAWTAKKEYVKVVFTMENASMEAFYKANGELIAISKHINLDDLPIAAKRTFAKRYNDYTVKEAIKFEGPDESAYYISAQNDKESVILKVDATNQLYTFRKSKI